MPSGGELEPPPKQRPGLVLAERVDDIPDGARAYGEKALP
jgi:hypothetical protein